MKLVLKYISMYLKSELEYKSSFIMTLISQLVTVSLSSFTVVILMDKFKFLNNKTDITKIIKVYNGLIKNQILLLFPKINFKG